MVLLRETDPELERIINENRIKVFQAFKKFYVVSKDLDDFGATDSEPQRAAQLYLACRLGFQRQLYTPDYVRHPGSRMEWSLYIRNGDDAAARRLPAALLSLEKRLRRLYFEPGAITAIASALWRVL